MNEIDITHLLVGVFGIFLIVNALLTILSRKYFSFFKKSFFIEPVSQRGREKFNEFLNKEENSQRYFLSIVTIVLGIVAIAWMFGINLTYF